MTNTNLFCLVCADNLYHFSGDDSSSGSEGEPNDDVNNSTASNGLHVKTRGTIRSGCKKVYDKINYCVFCDAAVGKISRHLLNVHKNEIEVKKIGLLTTGSKQRKSALSQLSLDGNFKHNGTVLEAGRGDLVVGRRSADSHSIDCYLPCLSCNQFFNKRSLSRHVTSCLQRRMSNNDCEAKTDNHEPETSLSLEKKSTSHRVRAVRDGRVLMNSLALPEGDDVILGDLFKRMVDNPIKTIVVGDKLIRRFAALRMESLGKVEFQRVSDVYRVSNSARLLARVVEIARVRLQKDNLTLDELIVPKHIDILVGIAKSMSTEKEIPSLNVGRSVGFVLGHAARTKIGIALRGSDKDIVSEANNFIQLMESEWNVRVNAAAVKQINAQKRTKVKAIPLTEDLQVLRIHILDRIKVLSAKLKNHPNKDDWSALAKFTMSRLILFNKRRRAEVKDLTIAEYVNRPKWSDDMSGEMLLALNDNEKKLAKRSVNFS
jgi:hypothetical protein